MASSTLVVNSDGYHGPVTATLDWCEANYQFSYYIAEMANTISNLFFILLAAYGAHNARRELMPTRYIVGFGGFALIGFGSLAFHATLLYHYQLLDELPMIYVTAGSCWFLYDDSPGFDITSRQSMISLVLSITFDVLFTWSYIIYRNPVYHQVAFGTLAISTAFMIRHLLKWSEVRFRIPDEKKSQIGNIFGYGAGLFLLGFLVWNLDNIFCDDLTRFKVSIGWPLAFLFEGHAWWHVLTGLGTYYMFTGTHLISLCMKDDANKFAVRYHLWLPSIKRVDKKTQ